MVEADRRGLALGLQTGEEIEVAGVDDLLRPLRSEARAARELGQRDLTGHGQIVVAGQAHRGVAAGELHAVVRVGAVAHEVAEAPRLGGAAFGDLGEHGL